MSVSQAIRRYSIHKDLPGLKSYIRSDEFLTHLTLMPAGTREGIMRSLHRAMARVDAAAPKPQGRGGPAKWDAARIEKLRRAYAGGKTHEQAAFALGVTPGAARLAHKRYLVAPATAGGQKAA